MKPRKLKLSDVTITLTTEPDDSSPHESFDSGDPDYAEADKKIADDICERFNRGDTDAWCGVIVTATWEGFKATDSIWGNSLTSDYTAETVAEEHNLYQEALANLNIAIADMWDKLDKLRR